MVLIKYCFFCFSPLNVANFLRWKPKKDIVRTYPWICMSAQCPHNVRTMSALCPHNISRRKYVSRGRCCADIVRTYISSPGIYVRTISFFGFQLWTLPVCWWWLTCHLAALAWSPAYRHWRNFSNMYVKKILYENRVVLVVPMCDVQRGPNFFFRTGCCLLEQLETSPISWLGKEIMSRSLRSTLYIIDPFPLSNYPSVRSSHQ